MCVEEDGLGGGVGGGVGELGRGLVGVFSTSLVEVDGSVPL